MAPIITNTKNLRILKGKSNGFMKNTSEIFLHTSEIFFELYIDLSLCHLCRLGKLPFFASASQIPQNNNNQTTTVKFTITYRGANIPPYVTQFFHNPVEN